MVVLVLVLVVLAFGRVLDFAGDLRFLLAALGLTFFVVFAFATLFSLCHRSPAGEPIHSPAQMLLKSISYEKHTRWLEWVSSVGLFDATKLPSSGSDNGCTGSMAKGPFRTSFLRDDLGGTARQQASGRFPR